MLPVKSAIVCIASGPSQSIIAGYTDGSVTLFKIKHIDIPKTVLDESKKRLQLEKSDSESFFDSVYRNDSKTGADFTVSIERNRFKLSRGRITLISASADPKEFLIVTENRILSVARYGSRSLRKSIELCDEDEMITTITNLKRAGKPFEKLAAICTDKLLVHIINLDQLQIVYTIKELQKTKSDSIVSSTLISSPLQEKSKAYLGVGLSTSVAILRLTAKRNAVAANTASTKRAQRSAIVSLSPNFSKEVQHLSMIGPELFIGFADGSIAAYRNPKKVNENVTADPIFDRPIPIVAITQLSTDAYAVLAEDGQVAVIDDTPATQLCCEGLADPSGSRSILRAVGEAIDMIKADDTGLLAILPMLADSLIFVHKTSSGEQKMMIIHA